MEEAIRMIITILHGEGVNGEREDIDQNVRTTFQLDRDKLLEALLQKWWLWDALCISNNKSVSTKQICMR